MKWLNPERPEHHQNQDGAEMALWKRFLLRAMKRALAHGRAHLSWARLAFRHLQWSSSRPQDRPSARNPRDRAPEGSHFPPVKAVRVQRVKRTAVPSRCPVNVKSSWFQRPLTTASNALTTLLSPALFTISALSLAPPPCGSTWLLHFYGF